MQPTLVSRCNTMLQLHLSLWNPKFSHLLQDNELRSISSDSPTKEISCKLHWLYRGDSVSMEVPFLVNKIGITSTLSQCLVKIPRKKI